MALDYGLNQISINGVTPDAEPSAKRIATLSKYVKKYGIKYIYFEENASNKVAKTLAKEAGVKAAVLSPLEGLTEKEMKAGEDYFTVMRKNLETLRLTTDVAGKEILQKKIPLRQCIMVTSKIKMSKTVNYLTGLVTGSLFTHTFKMAL